jgi:hypothetical protein
MLKISLSERFSLLEQLERSSLEYLTSKKRLASIIDGGGLSAAEKISLQSVVKRINDAIERTHTETQEIQSEIKKINSRDSFTVISSEEKPA